MENKKIVNKVDKFALEDLTNEFKKNSFALKLFLDANTNNFYNNYKNELSALLFECSEKIQKLSNDLEILGNCLTKS